MTELISITPVTSGSNEFVNSFASACKAAGFAVHDAAWRLPALRRSSIAVDHWPNHFFARRGTAPMWRPLIKMRLAQLSSGTRFVWVVHNLTPHDFVTERPFAQRYISMLDGIIHLSHAGRDLLHQSYRVSAHTQELVTVHGAYASLVPAVPPPPILPGEPIRLLHFGQIRPYKNVDLLITCMATIPPSEAQLSVVGAVGDHDFVSNLRAVVREIPWVTLNIHDTMLPSTVLERAIDSAQLVVLPYRNILNSGAAFLALSRARPIVAPRTGALPELQATVGKDWVYLYDGDVSPDILRDAVAWYRDRLAAPLPNLQDYSWSRISSDLQGFFGALTRGP